MRRALEPSLAVLGLLLFCWAASSHALLWHWDLRQSMGLDNAYFLQRVWQALFLDEPHRTLLNTEISQGLIAGRHVEPVLILALPWVWLVPRMEGLLVFQACSVGLSGVAVWRLTRTETSDAATGLLAGLAVLLLPGVWTLAVKDFRSLSLALPWILVALALLRERRLGLGALASLIAVSCREEAPWLLLSCLPWLGWRTRSWSAALVPAGLCAAWLLGLAAWRGGSSDFAVFGELGHMGQRLERLGPVVETLLPQLGPAGLVLLAAPLAWLPALITLGAAVLLEGVWSPGGVHLSVGLFLGAALATTSALGLAARYDPRLGRALAVVLVLTAGLSLARTWPDVWGSVCKVAVLQDGPGQRLGSPWEVFPHVPASEPLLTEASFVSQQAHRAVIYAADDWHDPLAQQQVVDAVRFAVLRPEHEWVPMLEERGWKIWRAGGHARLFTREVAPQSELNPLSPGELVLGAVQGDERCPVGMILLPGGTYRLGEADPALLERHGRWILPEAEVQLDEVCIDALPFPGRRGAPWPQDGLLSSDLAALEARLAEHGRRLCTVGELMLGAAGPRNLRQAAPRVVCEQDDAHPRRALGRHPECVSELGLYDLGVRSSWGLLQEPWGAEPVVWGRAAREDTFYAPSNFGVHEHGRDTARYVDDGLRLCADPHSPGSSEEEAWSREVARFVEEPRFEAWLAR